MIKFLLRLFLIILLTMGFTNQSWAMGMFKKHGGAGGGNFPSGGNSGNFGNGSQSQSWHSGQNDNDYSGNKPGNNPDPGSSSSSNQNPPDTGTPPSEQYVSGGDNPHAVPEPMTLTLMGVGLAGVYFRRRKS